MAQDTGGLFLSLGLDVSDLETGFIAAERTVRENMARLSRESNLIRLRAEVEIGNLDEVADAEQILTIRTEALNRQMAIQRDRIRLAEAAYSDLVERHGEEAVVSQRAAAALERERLTLQRFENELRGLNETADDSTASLEDLSDTAPVLSRGMAMATASVAALGAAMAVATEASAILLEDFRELQNQSYELNMSLNDTENFLRQLSLAGGDIGDFEGYIRGISDAFVKGESDAPETIALSKYGANLVDANGRLKDFKELTEEVYQAWQKADEAGEGIEFLQLTGGESGIRDAIQFFRRYEESKKNAEKIYDAGLDAEEMHKLDVNFRLLEEQTEEFKDALTNAFAPAMIQGAEKLFEILNSGTEFISENKEEFQKWGFIAEEAISTVLSPLGSLKEILSEINQPSDNVIFGALKNGVKGVGENLMLGTPFKFLKDFGAFDGIIERAEQKQKEYNESIQEGTQEQKDFSEAVDSSTVSMGEFRREEEKLLQSEKNKILDDNVLSQYNAKRIKQWREDLEDIRLEQDFKDDEYALALAENDLEYRRALETPNYLSNEEKIALQELYAAKAEQIEQDKEDRLEEIRKTANAQFKTELEKRLEGIDEERDAWISAGMAEAEATELAERQKAEAIENLNEEAAESLDSIWQTELEKRLSQIEREKQAWIQKGVDEVKATQWAEQAKADAQRNAAMNVIRQQAEEYKTYQEQGYGGLAAYKRAKLYEAGVNLEYLKMTPAQLEEFQKAQTMSDKSLLPNFMTEIDRAENKRLMQEWYSDLIQQKQINQGNYVEISGERTHLDDTSADRVLFSKDNKDYVELYSYNPAQFYKDQTGEIAPEINSENEILAEKMTALTAAISNITLGKPTGYASDAAIADKSAAPVTVNVSIGEAHAWDSEHIDELADKVANRITPEITSALGGDSNTY